MTSKRYASKKIQSLTSHLKKEFCVDSKKCFESCEAAKLKANEYDELIHQLKIKFQASENKNEKNQIPTMLPNSWSARKVSNEFNCSKHMATFAKQLKEEQGPMSSRKHKQKSNRLCPELKSVISNFYMDDEISRIMPGKNNWVSMKVDFNKSNIYS